MIISHLEFSISTDTINSNITSIRISLFVGLRPLADSLEQTNKSQRAERVGID